MSKQPNPTLIGGFALGGIALVVLFVIIITGDALFSERNRYVMYFDGSINGLNVGSNVMFRGVPVGFVSGIEVIADIDDDNIDDDGFIIPVYVDINSRAIRGTNELSISDDELRAQLIEQGLRASLNTESLLTGQLFVQLDFLPETEAVYRHHDDDLPEIPTVPSGIQALLTGVQNFITELQSTVDLRQLAVNVANTISGLDELANSQDLREGIAGANRLLNSDDTQRISAELNQTLTALRATLSSADSTIAEIRTDAGPLIESLAATLDSAREVLTTAESSLDKQSGLNFQLVSTLRELESAARSLRGLADYLERDPQAILRGRVEE